MRRHPRPPPPPFPPNPCPRPKPIPKPLPGAGFADPGIPTPAQVPATRPLIAPFPNGPVPSLPGMIVSSFFENSSSIPWSSRSRTLGTSSARKALRVHGVRDARISDTGRCRQRPPQGDRPCDLGPVRRDLVPVRRPAPWGLFHLLLALSCPPFLKILLLFPDPFRHPVPFRRVVSHSSEIHPFRYCAFPIDDGRSASNRA